MCLFKPAHLKSFRPKPGNKSTKTQDMTLPFGIDPSRFLCARGQRVRQDSTNLPDLGGFG